MPEVKLNQGSCAPFQAASHSAPPRRLADRRQRLVDAAGLQRLVDAELDGQLGELLQFVVRAEEVDVHALHHLGDRLIGDGGELLLEEAEEVEIGGIAEVQELEVILPGLVQKLDRAVVGLHHSVGVVEADALLDPFQRHDVGQLLELQRLEVGDIGAHLLVPILDQRVPILEIMAGALQELRHARSDVLGRDRGTGLM